MMVEKTSNRIVDFAGSPFTRRQFLRASIGAVGAATIAPSCPTGDWGIVPFEGIYTDRFTYRPGDTIRVHCSLVDSAQVPFQFVRRDVRPQFVAATVMATPMNLGLLNPVTESATFMVAFEMGAAELAPGVYTVTIPHWAIRPQNRFNTGNGFPSDNSVAYFVVTPREAGSSSRLLWVHDSLTGTAYGSFNRQSIYPTEIGGAYTVNYLRPGLDRSATWSHGNLPFLRNFGYEFEYVDLVDLAAAAPDYLNAYDLVCLVGQFEYVPNEVMNQLAVFQAGGGNVYAACNEFGIFRARLDQSLSTFTTYKWDSVNADPYQLSGDLQLASSIAGIGMTAPASPYETEIVGQTSWPAHRISIGEMVSLPIYNVGEAGWILEGTGLGAGDAFPAAMNEYVSGLCLEFDAGEPRPILGDEMRLPEGLVVWGARPSSDSIDWRALPGRPTWEWPSLTSGYATATLQQRSSGSQVVSLPSATMSEWVVGVGNPIYDRMLLNIFARLSVRA